MKKNTRSLLSLLLALTLVLSLTACGKTEDPGEELPPIDLENLVFLNPLAPPDGAKLASDIPNLIPLIQEMKDLNDHSVAWLQLPDTTISDVVVKHPDDTNNSNAFYLRRDFFGERNDNGTYYIDYRANVDGTAAGLSRNTVIYGHSMNDRLPGNLFNPLKYLRETDEEGQEFVETHPYLYFSLEEEDLVWEIFAAFDAHISFAYNVPNPTDEEYQTILDYAKEHAYYDYGINVGVDDKILTLSTCTYNYVSTYPNDYRYVVMARLVEPDQKLKETATFTLNESRVNPAA